MIEEIRINRKAFVRWFKEGESYRVIATFYNREVYNRKLDRKHYEIFHNYINERIKYLIGENIIDKEYSMILLDNTMYKPIDGFHFMELNRFLVPVDGLEEPLLKDNLFDIVLDATVRTGEIFEETDLVFHNGIFYNNGNRIKTIEDFKRDGIEFELYDLLNGITEEQLEYLVWNYYSRDFEKYVTKNVKINIDRWY